MFATQRKGLSRVIGLACAAVLLTGCQTTPPLRAVVDSPAPFVVAEASGAHVDREVTWGGMVIETRSYARHSEIEVLAFPLDRQLQPQPQAADLGRFVLLRAGFVDPQIFAPGRFVTATGRVTGDRRGHIRQAAYVWPELDAAELHLWSRDFRQPRSSFSIGIGIGVFR
jgi:outer membrane lipoprotein